jgi:hypothetical protein
MAGFSSLRPSGALFRLDRNAGVADVDIDAVSLLALMIEQIAHDHGDGDKGRR